MKKPIDRAIAKEEIERINDALTAPHLLIGGLAVQQYCVARDSKDIDLVCDFNTARSILDSLYPLNDWKIENKTNDEYRPSFHISHRVEDRGVLIFGPKISEREPYRHLDWNLLMQDARPFRTTGNKVLPNILVPSVASLAFAKFMSFLGRDTDKSKKDLRDFVDLSNHDDFSASRFHDLVRKTAHKNDLVGEFQRKSATLKCSEQSCLYELGKMFHGASGNVGQVNVEQRKIYISAPHRNVRINNKLGTLLRKDGFQVAIPYEEVRKQGLREEKRAAATIRNICIRSIDECDIVVVDLTHYGMDSAWEIGYAEAKGKRIVGYNAERILSDEQRFINRRLYEENFMHGWDHQEVFQSIAEAKSAIKGKIVYMCGSFKNKEIKELAGKKLGKLAREMIFPMKYLDSVTGLPSDYPLSDRIETNNLLMKSDVIMVALPRYGMDVSWQLGYATAHKKKIIGLHMNDDGRSGTKQSMWDHWMHGWKEKIRVIGPGDLKSVLHGLTR